MQFSAQTEYSVRILLYLTCQEAKGIPSASISTLSDSLGINRNYLPKILKPLRDHQMLRSTPGVQGGFSLAIDPTKTTLLDIFAVTEGSLCLNPCLESDSSCLLNREQVCPVRKTYLEFQALFDSYFGAKTLADLAAEELASHHHKQL